MTTERTRNDLIAALADAVRDTLGYFEGPGRSTNARIDRWGAWETLAHFPYWHYATTWGIASTSAGGPPWQLSGTADEINDACLQLYAGESFDDLIRELRHAQERLLRVAREAEDLEAPAFRMPDGRIVTVRQRLETIARHWRGHLQALQQASITEVN